MKKSKKIAIIISLVLIIAGFILSFVSFAMVGFDLSKLSTVEDVCTKTYQINEDFDSINIDVIESDIYIAVSKDDYCKVVTEENEIVSYTVKVVDNTLKIEFDDNRDWIDYFEIGWGNSKMAIYLPREFYKKIDIEGVSGDIEISADIDFKNIKVDTVSGDIMISDSTPGNLTLTTISGDIKLYRTECKKLTVNTVSGDVEFDLFDADDAVIDTVSGDVEGRLLTNKKFNIDTTSGDIEIPKGEKNGEWRIDTTSGDIELDAVN